MNYYDNEPQIWTIVVVLLLGMLLFLYNADGRADDLSLLPKCKSALSACDAAVEQLQQQVVVLKDSEKRWKKQATVPAESPILLVAIVSGAVGGGLGGYVAEQSSGMAKGGMVGALVGLVFGLVAGGK